MRIGGPEPPLKQPNTLSHRTSNSNMPIIFHLKSMRNSKLFVDNPLLDFKAPLLYIVLQLLIALPILVSCFYQGISLILVGLFGISTVVAIIFYYRVACTNPGYIMGSAADVDKRSGAYNPKDYQVESDRKAKISQVEA